jgi:hypothetical protein
LTYDDDDDDDDGDDDKGNNSHNTAWQFCFNVTQHMTGTFKGKMKTHDG